MNKFFAYFSLGSVVFGAVTAYIDLFTHGPVSGPAIASIARPTIGAIHATFPRVNVADGLVDAVSNAVAEAVNTYFKPKVPVV